MTDVDWAATKLYGPDGKRTCGFPGCGKRHNARGLCQTHDKHRGQGRELLPLVGWRYGCSVPGCQAPHHTQGMCSLHAARCRSNGDPLTMRRESTIGSFWKRVDKNGPDGCWLWTGFVLSNGYGQIASRRRPTPSGTRLAHRVAYELIVGSIPKRRQLDHLCRVPLCVNPDHLEPVTGKVNVSRGLHGVLRTHCNAGHELTPENTIYRADRNTRSCRICRGKWVQNSSRFKRASIRSQYAVAGVGER